MSQDETTPAAPKRSVAEIKADLDREREAISRTVDDLADRVDPRAHAAAAAQRATDVATETVEIAREKATDFVEDVRSGQPRALAIIGGAVAAVAAIVAISVRKK